MPRPDQTSFDVKSSEIEKLADKQILHIAGVRTGRPNQRITLEPSKVQVKGATISRSHKNKVFEYTVRRINRLPTKNQVRIHTEGQLYPGNYQIKIELAASSSLPDKIT